MDIAVNNSGTVMYLIDQLPDFLAYFATALVLLVLFIFAYTRITPQHEFPLIRSGNSTAAISLGGAMIGFVLPLNTVIQHSASLVDLALWGVVVLIVQVAAFFLAKLGVNQLARRITENETSAGIYAASIAIAVGLLNAGCMTP